jgi:type IV secretory pathway TraG/TraD family ATPase VirD4
MTPDQRQALRPLVSAWTSIAIKSLLGRVPDSNHRLWLCIDELPSLHKLGNLQLCLAEGRKYGAAMILGLQNIPQLEELYGHNMTKTMMDLCSTKLLFRAASYEMAETLSRSFGFQEIMEVQEGISYGANDVIAVAHSFICEKEKIFLLREIFTLLTKTISKVQWYCTIKRIEKWSVYLILKRGSTLKVF